jgi:hypothetical protein
MARLLKPNSDCRLVPAKIANQRLRVFPDWFLAVSLLLALSAEACQSAGSPAGPLRPGEPKAMEAEASRQRSDLQPPAALDPSAKALQSSQ